MANCTGSWTRTGGSVVLAAWLGVVGCGDDGAADPDAAAQDVTGDAARPEEPAACDGPGADDCADPVQRHQPAERIDADNVTGDPSVLTELELPDPPKSGFRVIVPPKELAPGEEYTGCVAWPYPEFEHHFVYAVRLYTTGGLHHSNVYGVPLSDAGASPYPACGEGQASVAAQLNNILAGDIMDVLFANSTQVVGQEDIVFPDGMAFELTTAGREITTSIHYLNPTEKPLRVEVAYDLFTMPEADVKQPLVPYYFDNLSFQVPAHSTGDVVTDCQVFGGNLVTMMPHTHERATGVRVELMSGADAEEVLRTAAFDLSSDIRVFDEPVSLSGVERIRYTCTVDNDLERPITYGIGKDEMCTLFGYMYPPSAQVMGVVSGGDKCSALNIGENR